MKSTVGKGTSITVTVPMNMSHSMDAYSDTAYAEVSTEAAPSEPLSEEKARKLHILLAEDNSTNQLLMTTMLAKKGWDIDIAENGIEAATLIRQKERTTCAHIPIIALTANAMKSDEELCLKSGMDDYLSKPIRKEKLFGTLKKHVNT